MLPRDCPLTSYHHVSAFVVTYQGPKASLGGLDTDFTNSTYDANVNVQCSYLIYYSPPGSSVHGILQARILEWVAIPFFRGSS